MMVGLLADDGIEARVGASSGGLGAYAPLAAPCEILVAEPQAEAAAALIASHFAARGPS